MRRVSVSRLERPDLLARRPRINGGMASDGAARGVNRVDQFRELVDLVDRGLISRDEFEWQRARIVQE